MKNQIEGLDFYACVQELLRRMTGMGVMASVVDAQGRTNLITLGWALVGPSYHGRPVVSIAVARPRYSWRFLEESDDFVLAVPDDALAKAAELCGTRSGRELDKFEAAGLTRRPSRQVAAASVVECPINIECRTYARVQPPHQLLTPEHRQAPLEQQHTIYFAQVLGVYSGGR